MIKTVLLFSLFITSILQTGKLFPVLEGVTLDDKAISVPKDTKGKYTFLALAQSKKAEDDLNTWAEPLYYHFMTEARSEKKTLFSMDYDVNFYLVPMFTGINQVAAGAARKKAVEHMDERFHKYTLFYKGDGKDLRKELKMKDKDEPYFFLLDETGKIVYTTSGKYDDQKMIQIENILDAAE